MGNANGKWTSESDARYKDYLSSSIAKALHHERYFDRLDKYFTRYIGENLAGSEILFCSSLKIKTLLIADHCISNEPLSNKIRIKSLIYGFLKDAVQTRDLYYFNNKSHLLSKCSSLLLCSMICAFFLLKAICFFSLQLIVIALLSNKNNEKSLYNKPTVVIGDDSLLSGIGASHSKVLSLMDSSNTLIFSPYERIKKKKEFIDRGFFSLDIQDLRVEISLGRYVKILLRDLTLLFDSVAAIWSSPAFSPDIYKFMVRVMTWRLFNQLFTVSKVFKFMVRISAVDSYFIRDQNAKAAFVYFSITPNLISSKNGINVYGDLDYSYMNVDFVLCDSISKKMFSALNDDFCHIPVKPFHPVSLRSPPKTDRERIVFMDNTWGFCGVNSIDSMIRFFEMITKIIEINKYDVRIKLKKNSITHCQSLLEVGHEDYVQKFKAIRGQIEPLIEKNLSSSEFIDWADLVISSPLSSVIYESVSSRTKVLVYDPLAECQDHYDFLESIGGIYCWDEVTILESIKNNLLFKSFDDYARANKIGCMQYPEFRDVYNTSHLKLENAIATL